MVKASIIIAAYNAENYLGRALDSALSQTITDIEVIVVDDCSQDGTAQLAAAYQDRDARIRVMSTAENSGPGFARNLGFARAMGEWIAILDADDAFHPDRLETLISLAEDRQADIVSDNLLLRDSVSGRVTGAMFPPTWLNSFRQLSTEEFVLGNIGRGRGRLAYGFMKPIIRHRFVLAHELAYRISRFSEDFVYGLEALLAGGTWYMSPKAHYEYTVREHSLTEDVAHADIEQLIAAERSLLEATNARNNMRVYRSILRHMRSVELGHKWTLFSEGVKSRRFKNAISICAHSPADTAHIGFQIIRHLPRLFRRSRSRQRA